MTTERTQAEARRVSTSFDAKDAEFMLHLLVAVDLSDPERIKVLRQHPRSRSLLARFLRMGDKIHGREPRRRSRLGPPKPKRVLVTVVQRMKLEAAMGSIRARQDARGKLPIGQRAAIAASHGISMSAVDRLVTRVNKQAREPAVVEAAE